MSKPNDNRKILVKFGEKIKAKRREKNITQEELAELVGITDVYLRELERGKYTATWIICLTICTILEIDITEIQQKYIIPAINETMGNMKIKSAANCSLR